MGELLRLAELCEQATGPDRDLDGWIHAALNPDATTVVGAEPGRFPQEPIYGSFGDVMRGVGGKDGADYIGAPAYTASLDAAMTLVSEGWDWTVGQSTSFKAVADLWRTGVVPGVHVVAATPALAICAATLRARARTIKDNSHG